MRRTLWLLIVFAVVVAGTYICQSYWFAAKHEKPDSPAVQTEAIEIKPAPAPQAKVEPAKPEPAVNHSQKMQLSPASRGFSPSPEPNASFSCSQQKPAERQILPGVSIASSGGVNIKTGTEAENIHLRRDDTGGYQVLWQKKY